MDRKYQKSEPNTIQTLFGKIASKYDLTNSVVSLQMHKLWNRQLVKAIESSSPDILLDLCAGTGEIAYGWLKRQNKNKTALLLDFCPEMLDHAKTKAAPFEQNGHQLRFLHADAMLLPLPPGSIDAASVAYGVRNIQHPPRCFAEVHRVLKSGSSFAILELTTPKNPLLNKLHRFYLNRALPLLGGLITREKEAYKYLSTSIQEFVDPALICTQLQSAGFHNITSRPLAFGIATLITAEKP